MLGDFVLVFLVGCFCWYFLCWYFFSFFPFLSVRILTKQKMCLLSCFNLSL